MTAFSRRAVARLGLRLAALWTIGNSAHAVSDRGLGGTGAVPDDPDETLGQDRGIGGTGVVGTIRRFGSIVVNDLRVAYPPDVRVTIDGVRATPADLRIGQVVRVLARRRRDGLATKAIVVTSEVVGPVEVVGDTALTVLGQTILFDPDPRRRLRVGEIVAVAGLRRPDGAIVASLVAPKPVGTPQRLAGSVVVGSDGELRIGGLAIAGIAPALGGRRVLLTGRRVGAEFRASHVVAEPQTPFAAADRLSIEGYVARSGDSLRLGSGIEVTAGSTASNLAEGAVVRAVVTAAPDGRGGLTALSIHVERGARGGGRGSGQGAPGNLGHPGPGGGQGGSGPGLGSAPPGSDGPPSGAGPGGGGIPGGAPASAPGGGPGGHGPGNGGP